MRLLKGRLIVPPPPADEFLIEDRQEAGGGPKFEFEEPSKIGEKGQPADVVQQDHYSSSHLKATPRGITQPGNTCVFYLRFFRPLNNLIHGFRGFKSWWTEIPLLVLGSMFNPCFIAITIIAVFVIFDTAQFRLKSIQEHLHINGAFVGTYPQHVINNYLVNGCYVRWYLISVLLVLISTEFMKKSTSSTRPPYDWYVGFSPEMLGTVHDSNRKLSVARKIRKSLDNDCMNDQWNTSEGTTSKRVGPLDSVSMMSTTEGAFASDHSSDYSSDTDLRKLSKEIPQACEESSPDYGATTMGATSAIGAISGATSPMGDGICDDYIWKRHYFFPNKFKSKYSFPSGDAAQAANLAAFIYLYAGSMWGLVILVPGVSFARVFYVCHWLEDTLYGAGMGVIAQIIMYMLAFP